MSARSINKYCFLYNNESSAETCLPDVCLTRISLSTQLSIFFFCCPCEILVTASTVTLGPKFLTGCLESLLPCSRSKAAFFPGHDLCCLLYDSKSSYVLSPVEAMNTPVETNKVLPRRSLPISFSSGIKKVPEY